MADLLRSLIVPSPTTRPHYNLPSKELMSELMQETDIFSTPRESPLRSMPPEGSMTTSQPGGELPIFDMDDPRTQALLDSVPLSKKMKGLGDSTSGASLSPSSEKPVLLGRTRSAANVVEFYRLCQERGITPTFTFEGETDFSVLVEFGGAMISEKGPFASKKEAKEVAAGKGVKVVKELAIPDKAVKEGEKAENWVGLLSEYCSSEDLPLPSFADYALGPAFACEATIAKRPEEPFGGREIPFPNKKAAKANAAKCAVQWLRENGHMSDETGSIKKKRKKIGGAIQADVGTAVTKPVRLDNGKEDMSNAQKVAELCIVLGINVPEYRFEQQHPGFYSGAAYFPRDLIAQGPIGEIRNIHGIKKAKDACAREILVYLQGIVKARGVCVDDLL